MKEKAMYDVAFKERKRRKYSPPKTKFSPSKEVIQNISTMLTQHSLERMGQRGISILDICAAILYGTYYQGRGVEIVVIGKKEVRKSKVKLYPYSGIHVVIASGRIITTYRNRELQLRYRY